MRYVLIALPDSNGNTDDYKDVESVADAVEMGHTDNEECDSATFKVLNDNDELEHQALNFLRTYDDA